MCLRRLLLGNSREVRTVFPKATKKEREQKQGSRRRRKGVGGVQMGWVRAEVILKAAHFRNRRERDGGGWRGSLFLSL